MKPSIQSLGQILYSPSQYVIPVFQRNYRWEAKEWTKLWDSILEIQQPGKSGNHFMGFLVFVPGLAQPGQHTRFHLVDGQQRLTTATILLAAIRNVARDLGDKDLADEIHADYLIHSRKTGNEHYRLLPKERDHESYTALVDGNREPGGRLGDALTYFEDLLSADDVELSDLKALFDAVRQRLEFMCATLEAENAYNIFKSLNSTGVPLGASDLIRNFVFMHVAPDDQDEFDKLLWAPLEARFANNEGALDENRFSRFFRDYLMSSGRYVSPKETFATFESRFEATGFDPRQLAADLLQKSDWYAIINGERRDTDTAVTSALEELNAFDSSTTYPLLLALFDWRSSGQLSSEDLIRTINDLSSFVVRRFICGESSRGYGQMFVRAVPSNAVNALDALEDYLVHRGWPDDARFEESFVKFPLYERGYTRQILVALERARGHKEPAELANTQVEHVLPQTLSKAWKDVLGPDADQLHAVWLHRPGNLTLSAYNQELWNHPFPVKRQRYADSNVVLTREISTFTDWGIDEIEARGKSLAEEAKIIWAAPPPARQASDVRPDGPLHGRKELRRDFWLGLSEHLNATYPRISDLEVRPSWTLRVPSGIRHIGLELRFGLRHDEVGIDVWFWREPSVELWTLLKQSHGAYNTLVGEEWAFAEVEGRARRKMFLSKYVPNLRDPDNWPIIYAWLGRKLADYFESVAPALQRAMNELEAAKHRA